MDRATGIEKASVSESVSGFEEPSDSDSGGGSGEPSNWTRGGCSEELSDWKKLVYRKSLNSNFLFPFWDEIKFPCDILRHSNK